MAEYSGFGAVLKYGDGAPTEAFTAIAQVRDIGGPSLSADTIEVSHRDDDWKQFVAGMKDGGEITFDLVYDPDVASHDDATGLVSFLGVAKNYRLEFADATPTKVTFPGILVSFQPKAPMADAQTADATIKVAGEPTWT